MYSQSDAMNSVLVFVSSHVYFLNYLLGHCLLHLRIDIEDMERLNLKKLNEVEGKEQYHVEISNRFASLEN
jgi:hypothetical protein